MRNSQKRIANNILIERFFKEQLWQLLLVTAFVCCCAWLFDKWIEALLFCISHTAIRMHFDKQYHCGKTYMCLFLTCTIAFFGIEYCLPLSISLLSCIPICFFISWLGYLAQDRIDCKIILKRLTDKTVWQMNENELADYCYAKGIRGDMLEFVIMILIYQMKYDEIGKRLGYAIDTLKDWSPKCKARLGIMSWNQH